ncbi:hypothetical protein DSOL_3780 [Desulfosporosinus metallidurans]|uniref:Uncharacterized protein n=1 Tax=Desulfosporosinus metallidurans TaxID=1888891 RepID=A0A1Q8QNQ3_9FIRM|nr:hypothetical protein DSOL_3780 [Desulfosporosinus metallidurans]
MAAFTILLLGSTLAFEPCIMTRLLHHGEPRRGDVLLKHVGGEIGRGHLNYLPD